MISVFKWVMGILGSVAAVLLATIYADPFRHFVTGDQVTAELYMFPWYPLEGVKPESQLPGHVKGVTFGLNNKLGHDLFQPSAMNAIRLTITNDAPKKLDNIRVDLRKFVKSDIVIQGIPDGKDALVRDASFIDLGEFKAGDARTIYIWPGLDFSGFQSIVADEIRIFTPDSRIKVRTVSVTTTNESYTPFEKWIDKWANNALVLILLSMLMVSLAFMIMFNHYYKALLSHPDLYDEERTKFVIAPDSFIPKSSAFEMKLLRGKGPSEG